MKRLLLVFLTVLSVNFSYAAAKTDSLSTMDKIDMLTDELLNAGVGANFFEEEVDEVLFHTNNFLSDPTFIGAGGPFNMILTTCMILAALFSIVYGSGMAYKMMYKGEPFDPLKILKVIAVAVIMSTWYSPGGILDTMAVIPNSIGSWTKTLYDIEVDHVQSKFDELTPLLIKRDYMIKQVESKATAANDQLNKSGQGSTALSPDKEVESGQKAAKAKTESSAAGILCLIDKVFFLLGIGLYRVGFWGTIFCQQICLGMLTIFGPIQWAFCLLPKWEGAWAKWITRYLTVHFYGAMLYFVGFYVLLLFDVVFSIQIDQLQWITADNGENIASYIKIAFFTSLYMLIAGTVSWKCLNLVPDLAAWMIPEGDTAFSTRSFGEGIAGAVKQSARL